MKRRIFSIFFALVLVLSMSLVTAVPAGADPGAEITSADLEGPYIVGIPQEFSVRTTSDTTYESVLFKFVVEDALLTDIDSFEYYDAETEGWVFPPSNPAEGTDTWIDIMSVFSEEGVNLEGYFGPSGGFPMDAGYDVTTKFRINFNTPKTYPVTVSLEIVDGDEITATSFSVVSADLLEGSFICEQDGWLFVHLEGSPYEIGFQNGYLVAESANYWLTSYVGTGEDAEPYRELAQIIWPMIPEEYQQEFNGIVAGLHAAGYTNWDVWDVVGANAWADEGTYEGGCSAFAATGNATTDGQIVLGHITMSGKAWDFMYYVMFDVTPDAGHRFRYQSAGGSIWSGQDWYLNETGLIVAETSLRNYVRDPSGIPVFVRIRQAVQYTNNIDDFINVMTTDNSGSYPNEWLVGDAQTGEICSLMLGCNAWDINRTFDGFYPSCNYPYYDNFREEAGYDVPAPDPPEGRNSNRALRWIELIDQYYGEIDVEVGKLFFEDDIISSYGPTKTGGGYDGKVSSTDLVLDDMGMWARWGNAAGKPFDLPGYIEEKGTEWEETHPEYIANLQLYVDRTPQPWTYLMSDVWVDADFTSETPGWGVTHFDTIQGGVNAALPGDTITVAAGVYDEQVEINKALTLQGVGDGTVIQPYGPELVATADIPWLGATTKEMSAIVSVEATGDEVTIRDLKIDGSLITSKSTLWVGGLVYLETSGKVGGVSVIGNPALPDRTAGIFAAAVTETALVEVTGCTIIGYNRAGIYALGGEFTADYHHNEINGPGSISTGVPNGIFFLEGANGSATHNTVTDLFYTGEGYRSTGIGTYDAGTDVTFAYNTISNVQNAFALSTGTIGTIVEYNNIFNNHTGVRIEALAASSIIRYNDIHDNDFAIRCESEVVGGMGAGNVAHYNNFVNNPGLAWINQEGDPKLPYTYEGAVCNLSTVYTLDATLNWWGDVAGPDTTLNTMHNPYEDWAGDAVSNNVDYIPWLIRTDLITDFGGWNIVSWPIMGEEAEPESPPAEIVAAYWFDSSTQYWNDDPYQAGALDAMYMKVTAPISFIYPVSSEATFPSSKEMKVGWNLIGLAQLYEMLVEDALSDAYYGTGQAELVGYSKVISPSLNGESWSYLRGLDNMGEVPAEPPPPPGEMCPTKGYWVFMVNDGMLGGFTNTPIVEVP